MSTQLFPSKMLWFVQLVQEAISLFQHADFNCFMTEICLQLCVCDWKFFAGLVIAGLHGAMGFQQLNLTTAWLFRPTIFTSASHLDNRLRATIKLLDLLKISWNDWQKMTWVFSNDGSIRLKIVNASLSSWQVVSESGTLNIILEHILLVILLCSSHGTVIFNADWTPSLKSPFFESRRLRNMIEPSFEPMMSWI